MEPDTNRDLDDAAWEARRDGAVENYEDEHHIAVGRDVYRALRSPGDVSQITGGGNE